MASTSKDTRMDARTLAALIGDADGTHDLALGRKVNDKRVRSVARDTIDRFVNRTGYTAHAYTLDEARAIVAAMRSAGRGAPTATADALRDALRANKGRKVASKGRKARKSEQAAQDAPDAAQES